MKYFHFKNLLRNFCYDRYKKPSVSRCHELHTEYEKSLFTAPVPDDDDTAGQFIRSTYMNCDECLMPSAYPNPGKTSLCKLAPLPKAVPDAVFYYDDCIKEEGKTPMRYNDNYASASATVASQPSDTAVQRDYLLTRLSHATCPKDRELEKLYNLYVDNTPKTYAEMIAIIKAGTYTINPKIEKQLAAVDEDDPWFYGPMAGIIWPGPKSDRPGYDAARIEQKKQYQTAKDTIVVSDAAAGLAALQAFEAWVPTSEAGTAS